MFTRFRTATAEHVFNAPLIRIPLDAAGAEFLSALGGVYDNEEELYRQWLIRNANDLKCTLESPDFNTKPGVAKFLVGLTSLLEFLNSIPDDSIFLYSYDRTTPPATQFPRIDKHFPPD
jgi:hypothetical protein